MSQRKQVMIELAALEQQLLTQQAQVNKHQHYFLTLFHNPYLMVPILLLPAFMMGWKSVRIHHPLRALKHIVKFMIPVVLTHIKA